MISIGVSGITAAQLALLATEHNVVNANTAGYTRQSAIQASNLAVNTGAGAIGQGVHVETISRMYDQYLVGSVNSAQTNVSQLDAYSSQISQIDNMLADANAGLSPALQDFFSGVQQVASDPSSLPARQAMVTSAQTLASRFQNLDARFQALGDQVNGRISDDVASVNSYASQIADINQKIVVAEAAYGQPANDLLDKRDQLVAELNKLIKVNTSTNTDGSYNVFIGSGQQLVVGTQVQQMTAQAASADPSKIVVGLKTPGGSQEMPESLITGGELGGLISFRNDSLSTVSNQLGQVAASLALTFNAQSGLGQDLLGNIAGDPGFVNNFFNIPSPNIVPNALNTGSGSIAATFTPPTAPSAPGYSGNFFTNLRASDYQVRFGAGGTYTVTRLSDNQVVVPNGSGTGTVSFDGIDLNISTVGAAGDKFTIQPYSQTAQNISVDSHVAADPRLIAAAAPMRTIQADTNTGSMTLGQGVVGVGYDVTPLPVTATATATTLNGVPGTWTAVYSDGTSSTSTGNISLTNGTATLAKIAFSGMSFDVNGSPAAGDSFTISRNTAGVQDGRNAVLFAKLQTQNTIAGGNATYQSAYAQMVADNGVRAHEAQVQGDAQKAVLDQAQATRDSLSGVNLDEEAANLIKFQQAYQAASKVLEVGSKLFDTILSI